MISYGLSHRRRWEPETRAYISLSSPGLTWQAADANIKDIKYGSGISLVAVTANLATVALGAFLDAPSQDLRAYRGFVATFTAGGKTAVCQIGEPGTGETLDTNLLAVLDFTSGWTLVNASVTDADTYVTTAAGGVYQTVGTATVGALYRSSLTASVTAGLVSLRDVQLNPTYALNGGVVKYQTCRAFGNLYFRNTAAATTDITAVNIQRVTAPSALGSLLYKLDGVTRSFESNDGLDPNTAWTIGIARP